MFTLPFFQCLTTSRSELHTCISVLLLTVCISSYETVALYTVDVCDNIFMFEMFLLHKKYTNICPFNCFF